MRNVVIPKENMEKLAASEAVREFFKLLNMNKLAMQKSAVQAAPPMDPAMMGGGGMPMDPMMAMGGGMPMDPAMGGMPPGGDPMAAMMGGGMPMDPAMGGMPPGDPMAAGAAPAEPPKEKVKPEQLMQQMNSRMEIMEKMLVELLAALNVQLSPKTVLEVEQSMAAPSTESTLPGALEAQQQQEPQLPPEVLGGMDAGPKQANSRIRTFEDFINPPPFMDFVNDPYNFSGVSEADTPNSKQANFTTGDFMDIFRQQDLPFKF